MISDVFFETEQSICNYLDRMPKVYPPGDALTDRVEAIVALMAFVRSDLDCPPSESGEPFPLAASIRSASPEIDSQLLPIADQIRSIYLNHGLVLDRTRGLVRLAEVGG